MEKLLLRLARQLDSLDEASLSALWSKYATITSRFEPTRRWEEACLVFSMIQAKRWKNQLFNYAWQKQRMPPAGGTGAGMESAPVFNFDLPAPPLELEPPKPGKILQFPAIRKPAEDGGEENSEGEKG